ncbi:MAG: arginyltransferase [Oceanospirillaceae bacterium]|nr:arginyltransferase [Oceanospirillaceae bacterium]MBT11056.1 arginyltransferase [Oceanospirillaceae bacterium]|tara:strand:- start:239647 stop:240351 length:705 start_codon:yes stop_codon:yes gene_type:complete
MNKILLFQPPETHSCSYLEGQQSRSLYVDPRAELDGHTLTLLSLNGFRRSGRLMYRPACPDCHACLPVRIRVNEFLPSRSQKRTLRRNRDLTLEVTRPDSSEETYRLYERYISERHQDGDMYPPSEQQYDDFLASDFGTTAFLKARKNGRLVACMVFDQLEDGLSSVYSFYDPDEQDRSLGTWLILQANYLAHGLALPYNYLGYLVHESKKMAYKRKFVPLDALIDGKWTLLSP